eukprot:265684-Rhodomonas_salina.1
MQLFPAPGCPHTTAARPCCSSAARSSMNKDSLERNASRPKQKFALASSTVSCITRSSVAGSCPPTNGGNSSSRAVYKSSYTIFSNCSRPRVVPTPNLFPVGSCPVISTVAPEGA